MLRSLIVRQTVAGIIFAKLTLKHWIIYFDERLAWRDTPHEIKINEGHFLTLVLIASTEYNFQK